MYVKMKKYNDIVKEKPKKEVKIKPVKEKTLRSYLTPESKGKYVKGDPESKGKSELQIEKEIMGFLRQIPKCYFWSIKVKGEIQSIGGGKAVIKESKNPGFPDILACIKGIFVGIEVKAPGRYQSVHQIAQQKNIQELAEGFYFLVTSVRELAIFLSACKILEIK